MHINEEDELTGILKKNGVAVAPEFVGVVINNKSVSDSFSISYVEYRPINGGGPYLYISNKDYEMFMEKMLPMMLIKAAHS